MENTRTCPTSPGRWEYLSARYTEFARGSAVLTRNLSSALKWLSRTIDLMSFSIFNQTTLQAPWLKLTPSDAPLVSSSISSFLISRINCYLLLNGNILGLDFTQRVLTFNVVYIQNSVKMVYLMFQRLGQQTFRFDTDCFPIDIQSFDRYGFCPV